MSTISNISGSQLSAVYVEDNAAVQADTFVNNTSEKTPSPFSELHIKRLINLISGDGNRRDPTGRYTQLLFHRVITFIGESHLEKAMQVCENIKDSSVQKPPLYLELSLIAKNQNQLKIAETAYKRAQNIPEDDVLSLLSLYAFQLQNDVENSLRTLELNTSILNNELCLIILARIECAAGKNEGLIRLKEVKEAVFQHINSWESEDSDYAIHVINILNIELEYGSKEEIQRSIDMIQQMVAQSKFPGDYDPYFLEAIEAQASLDIEKAKKMLDRKWDNEEDFHTASLLVYKEKSNLDPTQLEDGIIRLLMRRFEYEIDQKLPGAAYTLERAKAHIEDSSDLGLILEAEMKHDLPSAIKTAKKLASLLKEENASLSTESIVSLVTYILDKGDVALLESFENKLSGIKV